MTKQKTHSFSSFWKSMDGKKYSFWIGLWKTVKNSAYLLIPFALALLVGVPAEYAWITGPVVYFLKNLYENKIKK